MVVVVDNEYPTYPSLELGLLESKAIEGCHFDMIVAKHLRKKNYKE